MNQSKPFKTIEVIDSRTGSLTKIACMSCIRGHRTTSCGNTACRSKVLWTIKRPGRPANSCTCPHGRTGRCQCVVAQSACPHRPKKGEKRSVECRCDEKGRWCCILGPEAWNALMALQKPRIDFYPTPESITASHQAFANPTAMQTPTAGLTNASQTTFSLPMTPQTIGTQPHTVVGQNEIDASPTSTYEVPRFGLMGIGLPMGNQGHQSEDVLAWEGEAPVVPRELQPFHIFSSPDSTTLANSSILSTAPTTPSSHMNDIHLNDPDFLPVTQSLEQITMNGHDPALDFSTDWMRDYYNYQFPSAICQNCGLNGCTCKSCPAVMQSSMDGSWAQCCSRKHVKAGATPAPRALPPVLPNAEPEKGGPAVIEPSFAIDGLTFDGDSTLFTNINDADMMDFNEFVVAEPPDPPDRGCCCGGQR